MLVINFLLLPTLILGSSFVMKFKPAGTVRTDPLKFSQEGFCLSDHVHRFFGALSPKTLRPEVSFNDLRAAPGNTGDVVENHSLYWNPVIYRVLNQGTSQQSFMIIPVNFASIYYIWVKGETKAFPPGLKMKMSAAFKQPKIKRVKSQCLEPIPCDRTDIDGCKGYAPANQTGDGFLPLKGCQSEFNLEVIFPHCWDGVNLESEDQSHVTYTPMCDEEFTCFHWPCPASHPVKIPEINLFLEIYDYEGGAHTFADGTDLFHSDFLSGWDEEFLQKVLDNCDNPSDFPSGTEFCADWLTRKIPVTDGVGLEIDEYIAALEAQQPPAVDIKGTISAEDVDMVSALPSGACQGTLIGAPATTTQTPTTSSAGTGCCPSKIVGGVVYTLKELKDTSQFGCSDNCVYTRDGDDIEWCFKSGGNLVSQCQA